MSTENSTYSFDALCRLDNKALDRVMDIGVPAVIEELIGWEFKGWNINPATNITRTRKFKKGFFGQQGEDHAWGYNVAVKQNDFSGPWVADPSDAEPKRYYFFGVVPVEKAKKPKVKNSLVIDYRLWDEYFKLNPVGYTVDYLVHPDPANRDVILGKSYFEAGAFRPFLGYFILERHNESLLERDSHFLSKDELRTVEAFAEAFFEDAHPVLTAKDVAQNIDRYLERIDSSRTRSLKLLLFVIEHLLPRRSPWPFREPFSKMSVEDRRKFIRGAIQDPDNKGPVRDLAKIRALFTAGYYGDARVYPSINFVPVRQRARYGNDGPQVLPFTPLALHEPAADRIQCDVCVIGSGAGGAVVAHGAAAAGKDVVLLEEGPYVDPSQITTDELTMAPKLYKEGGLQTTVDLDMVVLQGKCLGGATAINNAICFRLGDPTLTADNPDVLAAWEQLGAHVDRPKLHEAYDRVEKIIGVGTLEEVQDDGVGFIGGSNGHVLLDGWEKLVAADPSLAKRAHGYFRKNYNRCLGCGYCNWGCAFNRKMSMVETYIPRAIDAGARVIVNCHVVKIEHQGTKVTSVRCKRTDGRELIVEAKSVVVACGAIGSSVLLMKSGIGRNVGHRFCFNAGTPVFARFPGPLHAYDGVQMASYIDLGDCMLESLSNPPLGHASALPGWFAAHFERMRAYDRFASAGVLVGTESNGKVKEASGLRSLFGPIDYSISGADLAKMRKGIARLAQVYFAAGAEVVFPATFADVPLEASAFAGQLERTEGFLGNVIRKGEDLTLSSAHPQGGNIMSDDPSIGTVDSRFRVHGTDNLYVCDASVFPTTIHINPQLTIMAMADYFTHLDAL